ncbi:unnamed protein product [Lampetra planeri]
MAATSSNNISMTINMATNNNNTTSEATGMATSTAPSITNNRVANSTASNNAIGRCVTTNTTAINNSRIITGAAATTNKNNNSWIVITNKATNNTTIITTKATGMCGHEQNSHSQSTYTTTNTATARDVSSGLPRFPLETKTLTRFSGGHQICYRSRAWSTAIKFNTVAVADLGTNQFLLLPPPPETQLPIPRLSRVATPEKEKKLSSTKLPAMS